MKKLRFVMIGGFLGAGKTTTMARLGRFYAERGLRVGLVTNDQAQNLVDTTSLRAQGFSVEEVAGACFCCKFDDLVGKIASLAQDQRPDIVLAEPVGSCTDLVATVVQPLRDLYGDRFEVAPYPVLFKPSHGLKILKNETGSGFSPKAAYIFRKQLEEADAIIVNRIDEIAAGDLEALGRLLAENYPGVPVVRMSAKTGAGFDGLTALLDLEGAFGRRILDIDYDIYAEGEAELGWLNASCELQSAQPVDLDALLLRLAGELHATFRRLGAEVAHLKVIGLQDLSFGVANVVSNESTAELSLASLGHVTRADIIVNARVAADPALLEETVREQVAAIGPPFGAAIAVASLQSFRPGRPTPTHRYAK